MSKCDFNKVALQLYWNRTSAWVFSCDLLHIFRTLFPRNTSVWLLLNKELMLHKIPQKLVHLSMRLRHVLYLKLFFRKKFLVNSAGFLIDLWLIDWLIYGWFLLDLLLLILLGSWSTLLMFHVLSPIWVKCVFLISLGIYEPSFTMKTSPKLSNLLYYWLLLSILYRPICNVILCHI